mgnify:CR=1 FL=1
MRRGPSLAPLAPLAAAYRKTEDEKYAAAARSYIEDWMVGEDYTQATRFRPGDSQKHRTNDDKRGQGVLRRKRCQVSKCHAQEKGIRRLLPEGDKDIHGDNRRQKDELDSTTGENGRRAKM